MANFITGMISLSISAVLLGTVFISSVKAINQTGGPINTSPSFACPINCTYPNAWTTSEVAMWSLLTLIGIVGLIYGALNIFGLA